MKSLNDQAHVPAPANSMVEFCVVPRTNAALLEAIKQPNAEMPWEEFVGHYHGMIESWAREGHLDEEETMDLLGEIYLRLVPRLRRFIYDPKKRFRSWLKRVVESSIAEVRARNFRIVEHGGGLRCDADLLPDNLNPLLGDEFSSDFDLRLKHARKIVRRIRNRFHRRTWEAFELSYIRGVECSVAAERLGMSVGTLYVARCRVLTALRLEGQRDAAQF